MIRLIDQIALLERMRRVYVQKYAGAAGGTAFADAIKMVQTSPVDLRPCGRWEKRDKTANRFCSECGGKIKRYTGQKFCEHCGCPMSGEAKQNDGTDEA